jgi:hypothetical protein
VQALQPAYVEIPSSMGPELALLLLGSCDPGPLIRSLG